MNKYKYILLFVLTLLVMQVDISAQPERPSRHGRTDDEPISGPVGAGDAASANRDFHSSISNPLQDSWNNERYLFLNEMTVLTLSYEIKGFVLSTSSVQ